MLLGSLREGVFKLILFSVATVSSFGGGKAGKSVHLGRRPWPFRDGVAWCNSKFFLTAEPYDLYYVIHFGPFDS